MSYYNNQIEYINLVYYNNQTGLKYVQLIWILFLLIDLIDLFDLMYFIHFDLMYFIDFDIKLNCYKVYWLKWFVKY